MECTFDAAQKQEARLNVLKANYEHQIWGKVFKKQGQSLETRPRIENLLLN